MSADGLRETLLGDGTQTSRWLVRASAADVRHTCLGVLDTLPGPADRAPVLTPVRARLAEAGPERLLDEVAPGLHYGPGVLDHVVLVTSPQVAPIVVELGQPDRTVIVHPPLGESVRLRDLGRALGDDTRMRMLQLFKGGARSLPELCDVLGAPRTTLLHHLALLRGAGLIDLSVTAGEANVYRLRNRGLRTAGSGRQGVPSGARGVEIFRHLLYRSAMLRVCVALLALLAITACSDSDPDPQAAEPSATEPSATETPVEVAPYVETPTGPVGLTATEDGAVWVVGAQSETVLRIPAGATEPDLTVDVPGVPLRTTAAYGSVWVTSFDGKKLLRLDPATGEVVATIKTGAGPEGVAAGFDSIWVVAQDAGKLLRIDPATNAVSAEIKLEVGARLVEAGPDAMYVAHYADDMILRVDPKTNAAHHLRGRLRRAAGDGGARREGVGHLHALRRAGRARRHHAGEGRVGAGRGLTRLGPGHARRPPRRGRRGGAAAGRRGPSDRSGRRRGGAGRGARPSTTGPTSTSRWPAARRGSARSTRTGCTTVPLPG